MYTRRDTFSALYTYDAKLFYVLTIHIYVIPRRLSPFAVNPWWLEDVLTLNVIKLCELPYSQRTLLVRVRI